MRINKVSLYNYRNHLNTIINFTAGINLILGRNGAGKSSVLEAIGFAMFNSDMRTKHEEALNIESGSSHAIIRVEFTASDRTEYTVERRIGSQPYHRLYAVGESSPRVSGTNDVVRKITDLSGIEANVKNIYRNLISCYQNQITQIFAEIESKRKILFDKIFNTDIYERIAQGDGLKTLEDRYSAEIRDNEIKKSERSLLLKDDTDLELKLSDLNNSLIQQKAKLSATSLEINSLKSQKEKLESAKSSIDAQEMKKAGLAEQLKDRQRQLGQINEDIKNAYEAQKIVEENQEEYNRYSELKNTLDSIENEIIIFEKTDKERQKKEKDFEKLVNEEIKFSTEKENSEKAIREIISAIEKQEKDLDSWNIELASFKNSLQSVKAQRDRTEAILEVFNPLLREYNAAALEIAEFTNRQKGVGSQLMDLTGIEEKILELTQKMEMLSNDSKKAENLNSELKALDTRLKDNESAANKLKNGICPFLKEDCLNIKENGTSLDYFSLKRQELKDAQDAVISQLSEFEGLNGKIREMEKNLNQIEEWKLRNENTQRQLSELNTRIELKTKDKEIIELKLSAAIREYGTNLLDQDYEAVSVIMNKELSRLNTEYQSNFKVFSAKKAEMEKLESELLKLRDKQAATESIILSLEENLIVINRKKEELKRIIDDYLRQLAGFAELKGKRNEIKGLLDELTEPYNLYLANINKAGEIEKLKKRAEVIEREINEISQGIEVAGEQLRVLKEGFSPESIDTIKNQIAGLENQILELAGNIANIEASISIVKAETEQNRILKENIADLEKVITHLSRKKNLTGIFRKNLRDMGKIVASRLIERIESVATENYRNISGRGERIKWMNNEKDTYTVYLDDLRNRRRFEMLSGGEQVSVALSLRAAMASLMTKANFTIFDEPTINLDVDRRAALAESLNKIMNNLEQAIIVTHDDSFREMAGKIIEL